MNFIKVGCRYINLDLVTDAISVGGKITLTTLATESSYNDDDTHSSISQTIEIHGDEAKALIRYLDTDSYDTMQHYQERGEI